MWLYTTKLKNGNLFSHNLVCYITYYMYIYIYITFNSWIRQSSLGFGAGCGCFGTGCGCFWTGSVFLGTVSGCLGTGCGSLGTGFGSVSGAFGSDFGTDSGTFGTGTAGSSGKRIYIQIYCTQYTISINVLVNQNTGDRGTPFLSTGKVKQELRDTNRKARAIFMVAFLMTSL